MMRSYPRPQEKYLVVPKLDVEERCPQCDSVNIKRYPVVSEGGWWSVAKCQDCLCSLDRERTNSRYGSMTIISDRL